MRVILLRDVPALGRKNDIKTVPDGYGRNFLVPRGLAKIATEAGERNVMEQKKHREGREDALRLALGELAKTLSAQPLIISVPSGEKGELFASISGGNILDALRKKFPRPELWENAKIKLANPIKSVGEHSVEIDLGFGVTAALRAKISSTRS